MSCHEALVPQVVRRVAEEIVEREIVDEPLGSINAVAVLIMVGGVEGVRHDDDVVPLCARCSR